MKEHSTLNPKPHSNTFKTISRLILKTLLHITAYRGFKHTSFINTLKAIISLYPIKTDFAAQITQNIIIIIKLLKLKNKI